ncbi:hypothetical protein CBF34_10005 [Vagococcus penaei]|uniref:nucleotidyltransferase n=1 Tax=Vagococcus penaei TaxID=633807 RepID=UPI000F891599|nr:nucleotidyltransferase [Vagococcus penaei]RST98692.1 hypothetical protein CBF34_10005 [Vagococcus penaei]
MLSSCGVIVEYNPFHNGHQYHVEQAKKLSGDDVIVAVMSGNFLQRGEPACYDKWTRANQALANGVNLVIELPFAHAVQSADYFAKGAVNLLQLLGVNTLCFGTDTSDQLDYEAFGRSHQENQVQIDALYQSLKNNGQSYPQQMTTIYRHLFPEWTLDFSSPNHILGMAYAKANASLPSPMSLLPINRQGGGYHDTKLGTEGFASATAIRQAFANGQVTQLESVVPEITYQDLIMKHQVTWQKLWPFLKYQIQVTDIEQLRTVYQMSEGLEYRLKEAVNHAQTFAELIELVKSKRYTWARLQRLCVYILLQVTTKEIEETKQHPYLRVLGFDKLGQRFLKQQKKQVTCPIITNVNQKNQAWLSLDIKGGQIYELLSGQPQDYYRRPVVYQ